MVSQKTRVTQCPLLYQLLRDNIFKMVQTQRKNVAMLMWKEMYFSAPQNFKEHIIIYPKIQDKKESSPYVVYEERRKKIPHPQLTLNIYTGASPRQIFSTAFFNCLSLNTNRTNRYGNFSMIPSHIKYVIYLLGFLLLISRSFSYLQFLLHFFFSSSLLLPS